MEVDQKPVIAVSADQNESNEPSKNRKKRKKQKAKPSIQQMQRFECAELNIEHRGNPTKTLQLVRRAIQMGYDAVVINIDVGDSFSPLPKADETEEVLHLIFNKL
jgi:hypothetical protein